MYSGAGVTRAPQLCCISLVKPNEATDRTLRLYQGMPGCDIIENQIARH
jgi:hypothetical protein